MGDGKLLSKLTRKKVVYNFRTNDLKNGGEGAPLTPIFHDLIAYKHKFIPPNIFLNIGGIANFTFIGAEKGLGGKYLRALTWNHTTMHMRSADSDWTYLQMLFPNQRFLQ